MFHLFESDHTTFKNSLAYFYNTGVSVVNSEALTVEKCRVFVENEIGDRGKNF
jgi:hypothetical protein